MYSATKRTSPPAVEPVTTNEVKDQLRIDREFTDHDVMIAALIIAARQAVERDLRRSLITQTHVTAFEKFEAELRLPYGELLAVSSITYVDEAGTTQTLASSVYRVDTYSEPPRVSLALNQVWPSVGGVSNAVLVTYTAGYGAAATDVPRAVRQIIMSMAVDVYLHPEKTTEQALRENSTIGIIRGLYQIPAIAI